MKRPPVLIPFYKWNNTIFSALFISLIPNTPQFRNLQDLLPWPNFTLGTYYYYWKFIKANPLFYQYNTHTFRNFSMRWFETFRVCSHFNSYTRCPKHCLPQQSCMFSTLAWKKYCWWCSENFPYYVLA